MNSESTGLNVHEQWTRALNPQNLFLKEAISQLWLEEEPKLYLPSWCLLKGYDVAQSLEAIKGEIDAKGSDFALGLEEGWLSLKKFERRCLNLLEKFTSRFALRKESECLDVEKWTHGLRSAQKQAVKLALERPFFVLTGGPGTGKTYTARRLVEAILGSQKGVRTPCWRVALLAPTGKAMVRLQQSMSGLEKELPLVFETMTLHRFLYSVSLDPENQEKNPAAFDLVLVDEASMVTLSFFEKLLMKIHPQTSLILMGDPHQLPPVQAMPVFETVASLAQSSGSWVHLNECVRMENTTLYQAAHFLVERESKNPLAQFKALFEEGSSLQLEPFQGTLKWVKKILEDFPWKKLLDQEKPVDPLFVFELLNRWTCLCSVKSGSMGAETINQMLYEGLRFHLMRVAAEPLVWIPVMATVNQKELERVNGEMGLIALPARQVKQTPSLLRAVAKASQSFFLNEEKNIQAISPLRLESLVPAWAMTIHKSQGSEFDHVECLLSLSKSEGREARSLLYTACTRAKRSLRIWCKEGALEGIFQVEKPAQNWLNHCKKKTEWA